MSPYADLPARSFWKTGVARADPLKVGDLYQRRFEIAATDRIATAGSCFAQHITGQLRMKGYTVMDVEPAPPWLTPQTRREHGYDQFSARYGNIYTARQLLQLAREAFEGFAPSETVWERKNRYYDALRPGVDPKGLDTATEVMALRADHVAQVRRLFSEMDVFVFTLGMTEAWTDTDGTTVFPTAPGTVAGAFDPDRYWFANFNHAEVLADMHAFLNIVRAHNPRFRMILTVSPVPLTATATENHVLAASTWSKSVLRAVAGELAAGDDTIDYFPAYELIATPFSRGTFYESNFRVVTGGGVAAVMQTFFGQHPPVAKHKDASVADDGSVRCEEELLEAFAE